MIYIINIHYLNYLFRNQIGSLCKSALIIFIPAGGFHCGAICPTPLNVTNVNPLNPQILPAFCIPASVYVNQGLQY
jgi:hypothetical protein